MFPMKRKQERTYLRNLASDVNEYCNDAQITSIQDLYKHCGTPFEVVNNYFSVLNPESIVKKLRLSKAIKGAIAALVIIAFITAGVFCAVHLEAFVVFEQSKIAMCEEEIIVIQETSDTETISDIIEENLIE